MDLRRLKIVPLFQGLAKKDLEQLSRWADEVEVREGEALARQGTFAHEFFIIEEGTADVTRDAGYVATLGPGDFFGEIGLIESARRTATVVATSPMRLIVMTGWDFKAMQDTMPHVAHEIQKSIEERLRRTPGA